MCCSMDCPECGGKLKEVRVTAVTTMLLGKPFTSRFHEYKCPKCRHKVTYNDEGEVVK